MTGIPAPTNLVAVAGDGQVSLSWNGIQGVQYYSIDRRSGTGGWEWLGTVGATQTSYVDPNPGSGAPPLTNGTTYHYQVRSGAQGTLSAPSNEASATPTAATTTPTAPTNLVAVAGDGQVSLSWSDTSSNESGFKVERRASGTTVWSEVYSGTAANETSYSDTGLTNGTTYFFQVRAYTAGVGNSTSSNEASATPAAPQPPAAPTGVSATPGNGQVSLSWTASTGATNYTVRRSTTNGGPYTDLTPSVTSTSFVDNGLTNGTTYYYVVAATNAAGSSANSAPVSVTPAVTVTAPTSLTAVAGDGQVSLSWSDNSSNESGFRVERRSGTSAWNEIYSGTTANETSYSETGLTNGTTYFYQVRAYTADGGISSASNEASATPVATTTPTGPSAPTNLVAVAGNGQVSLSWNGTTPVDYYSIDRRSDTNGFWVAEGNWTWIGNVGPTQTNYVDPDPASGAPPLTNGTTYYYRVRAGVQGTLSAPSNEASATPIPPLATPRSLVAVGGDGQITLSWSDASSAESGFIIERRVSGTSVWSTIYTGTTPNQTTYLDQGLTNGTTYFYQVRAYIAGVGNSTPSDAASATPLPSLGSPTNLVAVARDGQVTLTWNDGSSGESGFQVERRVSGTSVWSTIHSGTTANQRRYVDTGLTNGTTYIYRVRAYITGGGTSAPSNEASATPALYTFDFNEDRHLTEWRAGNLTSCGGIRWPFAGATIQAGQEGQVSAFLATDFDQRDITIDGVTTSSVYSDPCSYTWTATGGTFKNGKNSGQSVTWIAPTTPGSYTLSLVVDDQNTANQPAHEFGDRGDAARGFNDEPQIFTATVTVLP